MRRTGRTAEAAGDGRRSLALALEIGDPAGELMALAGLSLGADHAGDHDEAVGLARQAAQITAGIPSAIARFCSSVLTIALGGAGDLPEAGRAGAAGLARARDAGDLQNKALLLPGSGSWSPWSPGAGPTRRSPPSCTSASARSARTWTGSGTRPAAAAAPT